MLVGSLLICSGFGGLAQDLYYFQRVSMDTLSVESGVALVPNNTNGLYFRFTSKPAGSTWKNVLFQLEYHEQNLEFVDTLLAFQDSIQYWYNGGYKSASFYDPINNRIVVGGGLINYEQDRFYGHILFVDAGNISSYYSIETDGISGSSQLSQGRLCSDGNYIFSGRRTGKNEEMDFWLYKITPQGEVLIDETFGTNVFDVALSISEAPDGGYYLFGESRGYGAQMGFGSNALLIKVDASGNELWRENWGGIQSDCAWNVTQLSNDLTLACGCIDESDGNIKNQTPYLRAYDQQGNMAWNYRVANYELNENGKPRVYFMCRELSNGLIAAVGSGEKRVSGSSGPTHYVPFISVVTNEGELVMNRWYDSLAPYKSDARFEEIIELNDGRYLLSGGYSPRGQDTGNQDVFLAILDENFCEYPDCQPPLQTPGVAAEKGIQVYPNPTEDRIVITSSTPLRLVNVLSIDGKVQLRQRLSSSSDRHVVSLSSLPAGTYLLEAVDKDGISRFERVLKL